MKNLRRLVVILTMLMLVLVCMSATVSAAKNGTCGENLTWTFESDTLTISGAGAMDDYEATGAPWYDSRLKVKEVVIEDGVTYIGDYAFFQCEKVTHVTISNSVTSIGICAFNQCNMTQITIPDSVTSIGSSAFYGCASLTEITIPDGVTSISDSIFSDCTSLASVILPETVTKIGDSAFFGCSSLTDIIIPEKVTTIGASAFRKCSSLTEIAVPDGITSISDYLFEECSRLKTVTLPDGITSIGHFAFYECNSLSNITIPEGVTSIGGSVFYECSSLTDITIPDGVSAISDYMFNGCRKLANITIPENVTSIGAYAFGSCNSLTSLKIPKKVTTIGNGAFSGCINLDAFTIPAGVTVIDDNVFYGCAGFTQITIPNGVTKIGQSAFRQCSGLTEILIPKSVTEIGDRAFSNCMALEYIEIPDTVTSLGIYVFEECSSALIAYLPNTLKTVPRGVFCNCSSLEAVFLPASVTRIDNYAFDGCDSLVEIYYMGDEAQLARIEVMNHNEPLFDAAVYLVTMITKEPEDVYAVDGAKVKFSTDTNRDGCTFQWYYFAPGADEWKPCKESSAKKKTLTITAKEKLDGYYYYCEITDPYGNVGETRVARLTIVEPPKITTQPKDTAAPEGSTAKVTVKAKGDGLEYQWYIKNAGKDKFSKSSVTSATYSCKMSEKTDGRQVYCVVTDQYGNTVKSKTVTIYMGNPAKITTQPKNAAAPEGKVAKTTVKATGDGLTYQWYIKNPGKSKFGKSSVTSATYSCKMSESTDGRQAYCVITDKYGTSVKTKTVTLYMGNPAKITTQPKNAVAAEGKIAKATVKATGDGLTYQWYIKNPGKSKFGKSSVTSATYSCKMSESTDGRQAYCVITDKYGISVQTETVTFYMGNPIKITSQPESVSAGDGEVAKVKVAATGDGLTYQWYIKNPGKSKFGKSSVTSATYSCKMSESTDGREVYCVITDRYGVSVKTETVTLTLEF